MTRGWGSTPSAVNAAEQTNTNSNHVFIIRQARFCKYNENRQKGAILSADSYHLVFNLLVRRTVGKGRPYLNQFEFGASATVHRVAPVDQVNLFSGCFERIYPGP